jgi:ElaB/YqjD/DUF883 family membrane-anchored ribosome-binding protein
MSPTTASRHQMLDEDLQIVRVTLATILDDVRAFSDQAADAIQEAIERLDRAQSEFSGLCDSCTTEAHLRARERLLQQQAEPVGS